MNPEELKFPTGRFTNPTRVELSDIQQWIPDIESFPEKLAQLSENLTANELNWRYRPEGWTIKQVIHHCADSHMNALVRCKLTLTEDTPVIRPYFEDRWANLPDSLEDNVTDSIRLIKSIHAKWCFLLRGLDKDELKRQFVHPETNGVFTLEQHIANYAWHCNHHLAHVKQGIASQGKYNS